MSFWVQHGFGKADRISRLLEGQEIDGVVLSPAHEVVSSLLQTAAEIRSAGIPVSVDPQTYVYSIAGASGREHRGYGLEFPPIHWSVDPTSIEEQVRAVIAANEAVGTTGPLIGPSVLQRGFSDAWAVSALQYARVTARTAAEHNPWASLIVEEAALGNWPEIEEWLDVATTLEVNGFYLVVARDTTSYPSAWEAQRLANTMRLVYRLAVINRYGLLVGYSDFDSLGILAAGASGIASGWSYGLRAFRSARWIPGGYGNQPVPRVTSRPLLMPLEARGEVEQILRTELAPDVIPSREVRDYLGRGVGRWNNHQAHMHHLTELSAATRELAAPANVAIRLETLESWITGALSLLRRAEQAHVSISPSYRARLSSMQEAVRLFRRGERL